MESFVNHIVTAVKGFFMGAANVVPGVSGGTIALISGIYSRIIEALNAVLSVDTWKDLLHGRIKDFWKRIDGWFLVALAVGVLLSVFSLAKLLEYCLEVHPVATWAFFFGLILASAFFMLKAVKGWKVTDALLLVAGVALGLVVCTLSPSQTPDNLPFIFICGAIAICTMILPGVSGSFILVVMGKYDYMMSAVSNLDWPVLAVFALGCLAGILAFAKLLHWLLARWERQTMLVLTGFVLGSLVKVWPWANVPTAAGASPVIPDPTGDPVIPDPSVIPDLTGHLPDLGPAILWCLIGIALIVAIELLSSRKRQ